MDKEQIRELFITYQHDIYNYLIYFIGDNEVEDLVQEVFIKVMRHKPNFNQINNKKSYLYTVARHVAIDFIRRKKLKEIFSLDILNSIPSGEQSPDEKYEKKQTSELIFKLLNKLKHTYREVIILRKFQGFSVAETAQILGWSEGKVNLTLHRAMAKLKHIHVQEGVDIYEEQSL